MYPEFFCTFKAAGIIFSKTKLYSFLRGVCFLKNKEGNDFIQLSEIIPAVPDPGNSGEGNKKHLGVPVLPELFLPYQHLLYSYEQRQQENRNCA
jgi:hypothetical protein